LDFYRIQESDGLYLFWLKEILIAAGILFFFCLLGRLVRYLLIIWGPRFVALTATDLDDRILARVTQPSSNLVIVIGLYYAVASLDLPQRVHVAAAGTIFVLMTAIFTNIAYRITHELLTSYAAFLTSKHGDGLDRHLVPLLEKVITIFIAGTALIIILKHFNLDILSLVTALGIGSLAIGLAAKDTLANMISGFTLIIDRPFRIGDRIQLKDGHWGDVTDIGLRTTKIKTVDNTLLIIPNADLCNATVINLAFPDVRTKVRVNIGVAYGSDPDEVKKRLVELALADADVLADPAPEAFFVSFGDSALQMALFFWVDDYTKVFSVTDRINTLISSRFREHGILIPFPTRTVLLQKES
jgi:small-conductance mechanosensitive channel